MVNIRLTQRSFVRPTPDATLCMNADRRTLTLTTFADIHITHTHTRLIGTIVYSVHLPSDKILITSSKIDQIEQSIAEQH